MGTLIKQVPGAPGAQRKSSGLIGKSFTEDVMVRRTLPEEGVCAWRVPREADGMPYDDLEERETLACFRNYD